MKPARSSVLGFSLFAAGAALVVACGRTGLEVDEIERPNTESHAGSGGEGSGEGGSSSVAGHVMGNGGNGTAGNTPYKVDCTDAGVQYIYILGDSGTLYSFDPAGGAIVPLHTLHCPTSDGDTPFSMAVDRQGRAYVVYASGEFFRVSLTSGACTAIPEYIPNQHGFGTFGMGFSTDQMGPSETLYLAQSCTDGSGSTICQGQTSIASIDTTTFVVTPIGPIPNMEGGVELTGTGDGRLFGFYGKDDGTSSIVTIDKKTAAFSHEIPLPGVNLGMGWAFGFWGGDFYVFTGDPNAGFITRIVTATGDEIPAGVIPNGDFIVGAGVSTCAPEE